MLSDDYLPSADLPFIARSGEAYISKEGGYAVMSHDQSVAEAVEEASATGESLLFYFYSQTCHFCEEIKASFADFLEQTCVKVLAYTNATNPNFKTAVEQFKGLSEGNAEHFFSDYGTPLLFSYKGGEFDQIPIYGNHGSAKSIAKMMGERYSMSYLYEFSSLSAASAFLSQGYPVYLLGKGESLPDDLVSHIKTSNKRFGCLFKSRLSEDEISELDNSYGPSASLLFKDEGIKKEDCSSFIEEYYAS